MTDKINVNLSFKKSDVYTWANATKDLEGRKGYFGHSIDTLKTAIEHNWLNTCDEVQIENDDQVNNTFVVHSIGQCYGCFLPEDKVFKK